MSIVAASTTRASGLLFRRATLHQLHRRSSSSSSSISQKVLQANRLPGSTTTRKRWQHPSPRAEPKNFSDANGTVWTWDSILTPGACALLAATLITSSELSPAEASWWPFSKAGWRGRKTSSSPFDNTIPRRALKQRAKAEANMRTYLAKMRGPVQELVAGLREGKVSLRLDRWGMSCCTLRREHFACLLYTSDAADE